MSGSDSHRKGSLPDVKFLPAGTGLLMGNMSCNQCMGLAKPLKGGGKQHVRWLGKKAWVCAACLKVPA